MKDSGVTLIELLVVVAVSAVLIVAMGFSYEGWMGNYRIESQTKELYFDLTDTRASARSHNRIYWVQLGDQQYTITEDTNPVPDGNGVLEPATDRRVLQKRYEYGFELEDLDGVGMPQTITFNTRGLISWVPSPPDDEIRFRFVNTRDPDFDCIVIEPSRIWMGEYNTDTLVCERR